MQPPSHATAVRTVTKTEQFPDHAVAWAVDLPRHPSVELRMLQEPALPRKKLPEPNEVLLWLGRPGGAESAGDWAKSLPLLSEAECDKARRFRFIEDRWSYFAAHSVLRILLGDLLDCAPVALQFQSTEMGKPVLCPKTHGPALSKALQFNISHTRGMVAVAISGSPVGVDVESVRSLPDMRQLMDGMTSEVREAFDGSSDEVDRQNLFFRYWTLAEAFIKATGQGLDQGLDSFALTARGTPRLTKITPGWGTPSRWHFGTLRGTVAASDPDPSN